MLAYASLSEESLGFVPLSTEASDLSGGIVTTSQLVGTLTVFPAGPDLLVGTVTGIGSLSGSLFFDLSDLQVTLESGSSNSRTIEYFKRVRPISTSYQYNEIVPRIL